MSDLELLVRDALEAQVPLRLDHLPAWDDVLARAGVVRSPNTAARKSFALPRRRRLLLALAAVVLAVIVVGSTLAALDRAPFGGLTSWLDGTPGTPAPATAQAGFSARNGVSYAAFPRNTKLRLLLSESVGGKTFNLLGFRNRSSLCLRLVRTDQPGAEGANQCVTLRELRLSPAPALVASQAMFPLVRDGRLEAMAVGIFGFADDTVRTIELRHLHGTRESIRVQDNVFLGLRVASSRWPSLGASRIVQVRAVTRDRGSVGVPFLGEFGQPQSTPQRVPSYERTRVRAAELPGPATPEARLASDSVAWLTRREPRGRPFTLPRRGYWGPRPGPGRIVLARSIQPDRDNPFRVGVTLIRYSQGAHRLALCVSEVTALVPRDAEATGCTKRNGSGSFFRDGQPVSVAVAPSNRGHLAYDAQIPRLYGIAADGVRAIDLFLASGRVIPAALRNNVWTVEAPYAQFPAKLVAYDARHRPVWVYVPNRLRLTPVKLLPCPAATQSSPAQPPQAVERLDLRTGAVDGHPIFGLTPAQVKEALGRPDWTWSKKITSVNRSWTFGYGGTSLIDADLRVRFKRRHGERQGEPRATRLTYRAPNLVDAQIGNVLRLQPIELERRIAARYGSTYRRSVHYGSNPARLGCTGTFRARRSKIRLSFGLYPRLSTRPFLMLRRPY